MSQQAKEWCAGLPLVQRRAMEPAELQELQKEAQRLNRRASVAMTLFPVLILLIVVILVKLPKATQADLFLGMLFVAILALPLSLPFLYLIARDSRQRGRGLSGDVEAGDIKQFAGPPAEQGTRHEAAQQLLRARLLSENDAEWRLELLPVSGRVWRVNDQPVTKWMTIETVALAETPAFASIAAQWLEPVGQNANGTLLGGQRDMSEEERSELKRYAHRQWTRFVPHTLMLTVLLTLRIFSLMQPGTRYNAFEWIWFAVIFLLAALSCIGLAFAYTYSRRLEQDALRGRLHIFRTEPTQADPQVSVGPQAFASTVIEVLPLSQQRWTEDGRPAAWRMVQS